MSRVRVNLAAGASGVPAFLANLRGELRVNEPMARHTSWRVGGAAEYFYSPADKADVQQLLAQVPAEMPIYWIGLGSNLLVRDGGVPGVVVKAVKGLGKITLCAPHTIDAEAGASCAKVARFSVENALAGAEFLAGVPGSFGGAMAMNAGAFGGETWEYLERAEWVNRRGECTTICAKDVEVGYRRVELPAQHWFLSGQLRLREGDAGSGKSRIRALLQKRNASQPVPSANAGSVFCNPRGEFAARLVQEAGLKGMRLGDAMISDIHANFIINRGNATAAQIEQLIYLAQERVKARTGVELQTEVRIIGRENETA